MRKQYGIKLTGASPIIMHWDNLDGDNIVAKWLAVPANKKNSKAGDDRSPPWKWKHATYNDGKRIAIPEDMIRACLMNAGAKVPTGKGQQTFKRQTQSGMLFLEPYLDFFSNGKPIAWADIEAIEGTFAEHAEAVRELGFHLFVKRAKVGQSKHVRVRPRFDTWSVEGQLIVTDETITEDILRIILEQAGLYCGIGDWCPAAPRSPGPYGRFTAEVVAAK